MAPRLYSCPRPDRGRTYAHPHLNTAAKLVNPTLDFLAMSRTCFIRLSGYGG